MLLYCDQAAAMRIDEEVLTFYTHACRIASANQEALHQEAYEVRKALAAAGEELARDVTGGDDFTVCWADSGTGIFNLLFATGIFHNRHILCSRLEHPALEAQFRRCGSQITYAPCDRHGKVQKVQGDFGFAALTAVQSELGTIQDLPELFADLPADCIRFADAVQMAGKLPLKELASSVDLLALSGIKFGSPGGAALLVRKNTPWSKKFLKAVEKARHPDYVVPRVFPPAALSCAYAFHARQEVLEVSLQHQRELNLFLRQALKSEEILFSVPENESSPYILHCFLPGKQGAVVLRQLSERQIFAGSGSACAAEAGGPSPALLALGKNKKDAFSGLRISFDAATTENDVDFLASSLKKVLKNY